MLHVSRSTYMVRYMQQILSQCVMHAGAVYMYASKRRQGQEAKTQYRSHATVEVHLLVSPCPEHNIADH